MQDFLLDDHGDIAIVNGDFKIGASKQQHIEAIFIAQQGEYKEFPLIGFGAINYLKSTTSKVAFKRDLKIQLEYDGFKNAKIDISNGFENLKIKV